MGIDWFVRIDNQFALRTSNILQTFLTLGIFSLSDRVFAFQWLKLCIRGAKYTYKRPQRAHSYAHVYIHMLYIYTHYIHRCSDRTKETDKQSEDESYKCQKSQRFDLLGTAYFWIWQTSGLYFIIIIFATTSTSSVKIGSKCPDGYTTATLTHNLHSCENCCC